MKTNDELMKIDLKKEMLGEGDIRAWKELDQLPDKVEEDFKNAQDSRNLMFKSRLSAKIDENKAKNIEKLSNAMGMVEKSMDMDYAARMNEVAEHLENARKYEREANTLERDIQRGKTSKEKMQVVQQLRRKAEREKREAESCKQQVKRELNFKGLEKIYVNENITAEVDQKLNSGKDIHFGSSCAQFCQRTKTDSSNGRYTSKGR